MHFWTNINIICIFSVICRQNRASGVQFVMSKTESQRARVKDLNAEKSVKHQKEVNFWLPPTTPPPPTTSCPEDPGFMCLLTGTNSVHITSDNNMAWPHVQHLPCLLCSSRLHGAFPRPPVGLLLMLLAGLLPWQWLFPQRQQASYHRPVVVL